MDTLAFLAFSKVVAENVTTSAVAIFFAQPKFLSGRGFAKSAVEQEKGLAKGLAKGCFIILS